MTPGLVIGLGNALAGEDGFGSAVLSLLAAEPESAALADLLDGSTDLLALLDELPAREVVILVDTVLLPGAQGEVRVFAEGELAAFAADAPSVHQISPLVALGLFRQLYPGATTRVHLVALCVEQLTLAGDPSPHAGAGAEAVRALLRAAAP